MSWCTIESDPGVFTALLEGIGVKGVQMEELYTLDKSQFQELAPIYGLIFLFKWERSHSADKSAMDISMDDTVPSQSLFFAKQVIHNACATQALLSIVLNHEELDIGDTLREFKSFTRDFPPELKGLAISNSEMIRETHNSFARPDPFVMEKQKQAQDDDEVYHFVAYVPVEGKVYELDGLQQGPILIGSIPETENKSSAWLEVVCPVIQKRIEKYASSEIRFNLLALIRNRLDVHQEKLAQLISQPQYSISTLQQYQNCIEAEKDKRKQWELENARRKHNYIPFAVQLLKTLAGNKQLQPLIQQQILEKSNTDQLSYK